MIDISFVRSLDRMRVFFAFATPSSLSLSLFRVAFDQCLKNLFCLYFSPQLPNQSGRQRERNMTSIEIIITFFLARLSLSNMYVQTLKPTLVRVIMINAFVFFVENSDFPVSFKYRPYESLRSFRITRMISC